MRTRATSWLVWSLAALAPVQCAASIAFEVATRSLRPPSSWGTGGDSARLSFVLPFLAFPLVGALIASDRPKNPIGWICLAVGIICVMVPKCTENVLRFGARLEEGAPQVRFERIV